MPEPEILRRCTVCGAASRSSALFCPQCGNAASRPSGKSDALDPYESEHAASGPGREPEKRQRDLPEGRVRPHVEKVRKVSSVLREQVTYDPSVRFVVVAAVLFVVFVVILVLSKIIT